MATGYSPQIATDGLVFYYDTGNGKSYAGEPTVNVVANPLPTTGWNTANAQGSSITRTYLEENGVPFMRFSGVTNGADYPRVTNSTFANSATITGTFSTSLEVRGTPGAVLRFRIYENGSTKITNTITLTSEWTRYTFDNQTTGFNLNQPYFNPDTSNAIYDIRNIQVEAKAHATQFVNGTRSATEGLKDLTRNSTIDLTNAGFDSNAQLDFDGSDDRVVVPTLDLGTDPIFSIGMVIKRTVTVSNGGYWGLGGGSAQNGINGYIHPTRANKIGWDLWGRTTFDTSQDYPLNEWVHVYWVKTSTGFTTSSLKVYINGQEYPLNYTARNNSTAVNLVDGLAIGSISDNVSNYYAPGEIAITKIHNKALSAEEVQANYNALRGRFGI